MIPNNEDMLKAHKLSITAVRLAVLETLHQYPHSEAGHIFDLVKSKIAATSKQAIYNNLNTLVAHGIVREIRPKGRPSLYETKVGDNHHHLICRHCQKIVDTECSEATLGSPLIEQPSSYSHGFIIDEADVILWGTCPSCQTTTKGERNE